MKRSRLLSTKTQPDAWKRIVHRQDLYSLQIFKPRINDASIVPLVAMVHGGGFIMNVPAADDPLARLLADSCGCIVVSIDYRKAPRHPFLAAYEDVVMLALAFIDDTELPVNKSKVILYGSSAGGNLVLAAAQDPRLREKLLGVAAAYLVANLTIATEEQMARRPDPSIPNFLGSMADDVIDLYARTTDTVSLRDRRLSPTFFQNRENLPKHLYIMGCEHDMLCHEAKVMAEKLIGSDALQEVQNKDDWQVGNVRWKLWKGHTHAFDGFAAKTSKPRRCGYVTESPCTRTSHIGLGNSSRSDCEDSIVALFFAS